MYKIIVKYKDGVVDMFIKQEYDEACALCDELWNTNVRSIHLKELK